MIGRNRVIQKVSRRMLHTIEQVRGNVLEAPEVISKSVYIEEHKCQIEIDSYPTPICIRCKLLTEER